MSKILVAVSGTVVLVLLALSPAAAGGGPDLIYRSDLACSFNDTGFAVLTNENGDLSITVRTNPIAVGLPVFCQVTCNNINYTLPLPGIFTLPLPPNSGPVPCGITNRTGTVKFRVNGLGNVGAPPNACENPSVQVFNAAPGGIDCTSGFRL